MIHFNDLPTHSRLSFPRILPHWYSHITLRVYEADTVSVISKYVERSIHTV